MLTGKILEMVKGATGYSDEQIAKLHPGFEKLFNSMPIISEVQMVAEVVKAEGCFAQVKMGDKLVFDPFLNPEKSSGVMCPRALLPIMIQINALWEMLPEWVKSETQEPSEIVFRNVRCLDPGLEDGGVGGVVYQIRVEPLK
jgi:hypothetical protein